MQILEEIIKNLSKEEIRNFKLFVTRTNNSNERKDIILFDSFRKTSQAINEDKIFKKLYPSTDKNPYYRLKNRLFEDVGLSLLLLNYNQNAVNFVLNNFLLAKLFIQKNKWEIAVFYLNKAEKKAREIEEPALLELIYNEYIKLSQEVLELNPKEYIDKRRQNREKLNQIQEIDDVLALVTYNIKASQTFGTGDKEIYEHLQKTVESFSNSKTVNENIQLRFKLYHAVSKILLQQHNYIALENYLQKTYKEFSTKKLFTIHNHETKLQMLTYLCNSLFRNNKINESLAYANKLKEAMSEFNKSLYEKFVFYFYNILVNNYAKTNLNKAIEILNEAKEEPAIKNHPLHIGFVYLNLAVSHFGLKEYKQSLKQVARLYMLESYSNLDIGFRFKIAVFEIMIRYDIGDTEFVLTRLAQFQNEFKSQLNQKGFEKEKNMCTFIKQLILGTQKSNKAKLKAGIKAFIETNHEQENTEIVSYSEWLGTKTASI
ncbi:MAG: hypothetical protein Q8M29_10495 [Bacteroidota bacterium]|nr:hypothetical protein [Bacteroidota bacterium]